MTIFLSGTIPLLHPGDVYQFPFDSHSFDDIAWSISSDNKVVTWHQNNFFRNLAVTAHVAGVNYDLPISGSYSFWVRINGGDLGNFLCSGAVDQVCDGGGNGLVIGTPDGVNKSDCCHWAPFAGLFRGPWYSDTFTIEAFIRNDADHDIGLIGSGPLTISASLQGSAGGPTGPPESSITTLASLNEDGHLIDTAILSGTFHDSPVTGELIFDLYDNPDCSGTPIFSSEILVSGPGTYISDPYTGSLSSTLYWVVQFIPDDGWNVFGSTLCGDPHEQWPLGVYPGIARYPQNTTIQDVFTRTSP